MENVCVITRLSGLTPSFFMLHKVNKKIAFSPKLLNFLYLILGFFFFFFFSKRKTSSLKYSFPEKLLMSWIQFVFNYDKGFQ